MGKIYKVHLHYVTIDVRKRKPYPKIAYEYLRLRPSGNLCRKISEGDIDLEMNSKDDEHVGEIVIEAVQISDGEPPMTRDTTMEHEVHEHTDGTDLEKNIHTNALMAVASFNETVESDI